MALNYADASAKSSCLNWHQASDNPLSSGRFHIFAPQKNEKEQ
jgi:hypothetical protein